MRRVVLILGVALAAGMLVPGGATADDRSLRAAGQSHDAQFEKHAREITRATRVFKRSRYKRGLNRMLRGLKAFRKELKEWRPAVEREQPSSPDGATYKRLLLQSAGELDTALRWDIRAGRAFRAGRNKAAIRYSNRAIKYSRLAAEHEKQAIRAIKRSLG
jgi:hypothetical protein